jgi:hypothetical protein
MKVLKWSGINFDLTGLTCRYYGLRAIELNECNVPKQEQREQLK